MSGEIVEGPFGSPRTIFSAFHIGELRGDLPVFYCEHIDSMLRLKAICCGLNLEFFRGQHCTAVEMQAITAASTALRLTAAVNRNGRLTDIVPLIPGSFTFIREVIAASARTAIAK